MTVDQFAELLRHPDTKLESDEFYESRTTGQLGYSVHCSLHGKQFWFSVSARAEPMALCDVADAISSERRSITREGEYKRAGYEATVYSAPHWYMLGHGDNRG